MTLTSTVQGWLRDVGPRERSAVIARTHVEAETSTDVDRICTTVSADAFFAVPVRTRAGHELPAASVLTGAEEVAGYYAGRSGSYVVTASTQVFTTATDWYVFNESAATLRGTGMVDGIDATDRVWVVNSAVLFPTAPDGIRGEICVTRHPFGDVVTGRVVEADGPGASRGVVRQAEHSLLSDRFVAAWRTGDPDAVAELLADRASLAVRLDAVDGTPQVHRAVGRAEVAAALAGMVPHDARAGAPSEGRANARPGAPSEGRAGARGGMAGGQGPAADDTVAVITRLATEWYVFNELLVRGAGADGRGIRRLALTQPVEGGCFTGAFGYGLDQRGSA
jgi:hypothetical protein